MSVVAVSLVMAMLAMLAQLEGRLRWFVPKTRPLTRDSRSPGRFHSPSNRKRVGKVRWSAWIVVVVVTGWRRCSVGHGDGDDEVG